MVKTVIMVYPWTPVQAEHSFEAENTLIVIS